MATPIYAIDFGAGDALQIYGPEGLVSKKSLALPRVAGGKSQQDEFYLVLAALLELGDVVTESATVGACGAEPREVEKIVGASPNVLYVVSNRAVLNYRRDHPGEEEAWMKGGRYPRDGAPPPVILTLHEQKEVHKQDARIIYQIANESPERLRIWRMLDPADRPIRHYTSVRPSDKRLYRDARSDRFMKNLPSFATLPADLQQVLGVKGDYSRSMIMPFGMALTERYVWSGDPEQARNRFTKILGAYEHGYPSFYRRMTINWMQDNAKRLAGVTRMQEVSHEARKEAWRITTRQIRHLFHLSREHLGR